MQYIENFIIILVSTIIFITAVELIAPNNSIKKYIKFVLGLILVVVILNPIVYLFTRGENDVIEAINSYESYFDSSMSQEGEVISRESREEAFKENLNKNCNAMLKEEFGDKNFSADIECTFDFDNMTYTIDSLSLGVSDKSIKLVDEIKININPNKSKEVLSDEVDVQDEEEIRDYLCEAFKIQKEKINIYAVER